MWGFRVRGVDSKSLGLGFRVERLRVEELRVEELGQGDAPRRPYTRCREYGVEFRVQGVGFSLGVEG